MAGGLKSTSPEVFPVFPSNPSVSSQTLVNKEKRLKDFLPEFLQPSVEVSALYGLSFVCRSFLLYCFVVYLLYCQVHVVCCRYVFRFVLRFGQFLFSVESRHRFIDGVTWNGDIAQFFVFRQLGDITSCSGTCQSA